ERCMGAILPDFGGIAGFFPQIVQSPGTVSFFYDTGQGQGWQRVIPVTGRAHLPSDLRQWWGDSRGHWEGNTLVVDVTNFTPKTDFQGSRENLHLVERWTRLDANTLEYAVTIEDATTWTRPWTVKLELNKQSDQINRARRREGKESDHAKSFYRLVDCGGNCCCGCDRRCHRATDTARPGRGSNRRSHSGRQTRLQRSLAGP